MVFWRVKSTLVTQFVNQARGGSSSRRKRERGRKTGRESNSVTLLTWLNAKPTLNILNVNHLFTCPRGNLSVTNGKRRLPDTCDGISCGRLN